MTYNDYTRSILNIEDQNIYFYENYGVRILFRTRDFGQMGILEL